MGQTKLIHEHYDSKPWAGIICGTLFVCIAIFRLVLDSDTDTWFRIFFSAIILLPSVVILVIDIVWKKKPIVVVYNDRLEVRKPMSSKRIEILFSDIRNMALESGQLRVWLDEYSKPACYNLGANLKNGEDTYNILRTAYDGYNQEHNFKPVPLWNLPKKKAGLGKVVLIVTVFCLVVTFIILEHYH